MEVNEELRAKLDQLAKLPGSVRAGIVAAIVLLVAGGYFFSCSTRNMAIASISTSRSERQSFAWMPVDAG